MKLNKGGIQIKTSAEQEAIYRGKRSTLLRGIHINLTYTVGKALSIFFGKYPLWVLWELVWAPLQGSCRN